MRPEPTASFEASFQPGVVLLAEYLIDREIERGDDWALYHAQHVTRSSERFRVRVLRRDIAERPDATDALVSRAARLARLVHPGVVPIVTGRFDRNRDCAIIVSRDRVGVSLRERLASRARRLTPSEIARILCQVGDALAYLHGQHPPIAHGALDSSCVFLAAPDANARLIGLDEPVAESDGIAADQFALASIAYECLTGIAPFAAGIGSNDGASRPRLVLDGELASKSADLDWVLQRAWASDASRRFSSVGRFAAEIARVLGESSAMNDARVRRTDVRVEAPILPSSGTLPATRLPTLATRTRVPPVAASAPYTPPSGERPAILPNVGRYSYQPEPLPLRTPPRAAPVASPSGERVAVRPDALQHPPAISTSGSSSANVTAVDSAQPISKRRVPPPLPPARADTVTESPFARTPTIIGVPVEPSTPTLVAEIEPEDDDSNAPDLELVPDTDEPAPSAALAYVAPPDPTAPMVSRPAVPSSIEPEALQRVSSPDQPVPAPVPIPLVTVPLHRSANRVEPRRRRSIHLIGACLLALAFGGADRVAPRVRRLAPVVWRWAHDVTARTPEAAHSPPLNPTPRSSAIVPAPSATHVEPVAPSARAALVTAVVEQRPNATDRADAAEALRAVINDCSSRVGRAHRHARFSVDYEGRTGAAVGLTFSDPFFRTHALGACIADGARHVSVRPFTDQQWVGSYSILVP